MFKKFATILLSAAVLISLPGCLTNRTVGAGIDDSSADLALKRKLLFQRDGYNYSDVDITVFEGRLMLTGTVENAAARESLAQKAEEIPAVREVLNEVIVGEHTTRRQGLSDAIIDERLGAALRADAGIYRSNFQIAVSRGVVYLLGVAQGPEEMSRVEGHAKAINGVSNVVSHVVFVGDPRRKRT